MRGYLLDHGQLNTEENYTFPSLAVDSPPGRGGAYEPFPFSMMKHLSARLPLCVHEYSSHAMLGSQLHGLPPLPVTLTSFLSPPSQCSLSLAEGRCVWGVGVIKIFVDLSTQVTYPLDFDQL